jgi:glycine hydroxymethyltransferase
MAVIVDLIDKVLLDIDNENTISEVRKSVNDMMDKFPMFAW